MLLFWNQSSEAAQIADLNGDGVVGIHDLNIVNGPNWNLGTPPNDPLVTYPTLQSARRFKLVLFSGIDPGTTLNEIGHQGLFHDEEFGSSGGLIHNRGRTLHPRFGRFMQRDPAGYTDSFNLYEGLTSNPLNLLDPTGATIKDSTLIRLGFGREMREYMLTVFAELDTCDLRRAESAAAQERLENSALYRLRGGVSVTASSVTFGLTDKIGLTESDRFQGAAYDTSRLVAGVSREFAIAALTAGAGQVARGGIQGTSLVANGINRLANSNRAVRVARNLTTGVSAVEAGTGGFQVGTGAGQILNGDTSAGLKNIAFGGLRTGSGFLGARQLASPPGRSVPRAGGNIENFTTTSEQVFFRVSSKGNSATGSFLTSVPPRSAKFAREALALPGNNRGNLIQRVVVPAGTQIRRSRALAAFGRRGGGEQFQLLGDHIPTSNFGPQLPLR